MLDYATALGLLVAIAVAVLKYRLYDIDRIINRTLVYGLLTAVLGLCYVAGSLLFVLVAGAGSDPPSWLVAATTLAAAAVFRPARRRIQATVDRRFNRRRYHAARTIEAFSARLRDEVDLDTLLAELLAVVDQTMEPTRASVVAAATHRAFRPFHPLTLNGSSRRRTNHHADQRHHRGPERTDRYAAGRLIPTGGDQGRLLAVQAKGPPANKESP